MALNLPTTPIATRVGDVPAVLRTPDDVAAAEQLLDAYEVSKRDAAFIRRAAEKEGQSYLMLRGPNFRVVFDHFILASYQKTVEEVVLPSYTRGQSVLEIFGRRVKQVMVEIDLIESSTRLQVTRGGISGYVGQGVRAFADLYNDYFRGSRAVKKDAIVVLSVKGKRDFGYVSSLTFERNSGNDHHVRANLAIWIPDDGVDNIVGARLAQKLLEESATARLPASDTPGKNEPPDELTPENLPLREDYASRFTDDGEIQNRATFQVLDRFGNQLFKYDNMYVTQVADVDSEKVQYEVSSPSVTKAWFYGRHLKALSISAVLFDLEQQEEAEYPQAQLDLFEHLYETYLRAPQVAHHRYQVRLFVRGHRYEGLISNYSLGLASDDDNIGAVSFTFMVLDENPLAQRLPRVISEDVDLGPATFSRETVDELRKHGELPRFPQRNFLPGSSESDVVRRTGLA